MGIRQNKTKGATGWSTEPKLVLCPEAAACSGPAQVLLARGAAARGWVTLLLGDRTGQSLLSVPHRYLLRCCMLTCILDRCM